MRLSIVMLLLVFCLNVGMARDIIRSSGRSKRSGTLEIRSFIDTVGPRLQVDLIMVLDRSKGVNMERFYLEAKVISERLVRQYATVHPWYVRVAAITFAKDSTVDIDFISEASQNVSKCQLFDRSATSPWDSLQFNSDPAVIAGTNIKLAFQQAKLIFEKGKQNRNSVKQVLVLVSDGDYKPHEDPQEQANELKDVGVKIFAVGFGSWLRTGNIAILATKPEYSAERKTWMNMTDTYPTSFDISKCPLGERGGGCCRLLYGW